MICCNPRKDIVATTQMNGPVWRFAKRSLGKNDLSNAKSSLNKDFSLIKDLTVSRNIFKERSSSHPFH